MGNLIQTQRSYSDFWTGKIYNMYQDNCTHEVFLISEDTSEKIQSFLCAAFNSITYKFWDKSEITLQVGQFLKIEKLNPPIAKKFTGIQKRFVKL